MLPSWGMMSHDTTLGGAATSSFDWEESNLKCLSWRDLRKELK